MGSSPESLDPVTTVKVQTVPQVPSNLAVTVVDQNRLSVVWDALTTSQNLGYASSLTGY